MKSLDLCHLVGARLSERFTSLSYVKRLLNTMADGDNFYDNRRSISRELDQLSDDIKQAADVIDICLAEIKNLASKNENEASKLEQNKYQLYEEIDNNRELNHRISSLLDENAELRQVREFQSNSNKELALKQAKLNENYDRIEADFQKLHLEFERVMVENGKLRDENSQLIVRLQGRDEQPEVRTGNDYDYVYSLINKVSSNLEYINRCSAVLGPDFLDKLTSFKVDKSFLKKVEEVIHEIDFKKRENNNFSSIKRVTTEVNRGTSNHRSAVNNMRSKSRTNSKSPGKLNYMSVTEGGFVNSLRNYDSRVYGRKPFLNYTKANGDFFDKSLNKGGEAQL